MLRNQKFINISSFILLIFSLVWFKEINFLFYDSTESPDFAEYFVYFDHFANTEFKTAREHGLMYYYLQYLNFYFQYNSFSNIEMFLHKSLQEVNFWIYMYGLLGYFYLLKLYKFKNSTIFITFVFLNFFPVSIVLRLVFKPEIMAFALLPWILYCIEKFKERTNILYMYIMIPLFISCITLKGNILAIICAYLLITNLNIFSKIKKMHLFIILLLVAVLFLSISYENSWLQLYDIPIFYFPKFFHPDPTVKRQSGFLTPSILNSSTTGGSINIPYFKVISENKDITFTPRIYFNNDFLIKNEYRQVEKNTNHISDFSLKKLDTQTKSHFFSNTKYSVENNFEFSEIEINLEKTSSDTYLKSDNITSATREADNQNLLNSFVLMLDFLCNNILNK